MCVDNLDHIPQSYLYQASSEQLPKDAHQILPDLELRFFMKGQALNESSGVLSLL